MRHVLESATFLKVLAMLFLSFLFIKTEIKSQNFIDPTFVNVKADNSFITIDGLAGYDSDVIKREMAWSFLKGGFLARDIRENSIPLNDNLKNIGAELSTGLNFSFPAKKLFGKDSLNLILSISQEQSFALNLNKNAYELFFFGNERFKGETISLDDFQYNNWGLRSIGIGVLNRKNNSFLNLNLYQGLTHDHFSLENGSLNTGEDGRFLIANLEGSIFDNQYNENNRKSTKGVGVGIDGRIELLGDRSESKLFLNMRDVGFMIWPSGGKKVEIDSIYNFEGVIFNDLFSPGNSNDTITVLNSVFSTEKVDADNVEMLPARIGIDFAKPINMKTSLVCTAQSKSINQWRPEIEVGMIRNIRQKLIVGALVKYGGYGNANLNIICSYRTSTNLELNTKISYLSGWLVKSGYGSQISLGIKQYFNLSSKVE